MYYQHIPNLLLELMVLWKTKWDLGVIIGPILQQIDLRLDLCQDSILLRQGWRNFRTEEGKIVDKSEGILVVESDSFSVMETAEWVEWEGRKEVTRSFQQTHQFSQASSRMHAALPNCQGTFPMRVAALLPIFCISKE